MEFTKDVLKIDPAEEIERVSAFLKKTILVDLRKKGAVVGLSGGIDSALSAALCVEALGPEKVIGVILPERDSSTISEEYALLHAKQLGIVTETVDISTTLETFGVYKKRNHIVQKLFPDFDERSWKYKIVLPEGLLDKNRLNVFSLVVELPEGSQRKKRLPLKDYLEIVAATNMKQRTRMIYLYYFAERHNFAEVGTTNRTEARQGFFVKYGDGGVDLEPLAHLYKSQVYMLANHLKVPKEILVSPPSPDTYTAEVSDTEFYFGVPFDILDPFLWANENGIERDKICEVLSLTHDQYTRLKHDVDRKFKMSWHFMQTPPTLFSSG